MSLTRVLETPGNPLRPFLRQMFPGMWRALKEGRRSIADAKTIMPAASASRSRIGMAIDYRLRYYFEPTASRKLTAYIGALATTGYFFKASPGTGAGVPYGDGDYLSRTLVKEFFNGVDALLAELQPAKRRLQRDEEELLGRYCYVLALFEEVCRGGYYAFEMTPLRCPPVRSMEELMQLAPPVCIRDLRRLSYGFWEEFRKTIDTYTSVVPNPSFEGSDDVGGADGDLILDDSLIDIKTTIKLNLPLHWLYQVLSYALLDYSDSYSIRNVGFYLARQHRMLTWSLEELTIPAHGHALASVDEIRSQFRSLVTASVASGTLA